jgi:hypothetical protein
LQGNEGGSALKDKWEWAISYLEPEPLAKGVWACEGLLLFEVVGVGEYGRSCVLPMVGLSWKVESINCGGIESVDDDDGSWMPK